MRKILLTIILISTCYVRAKLIRLSCGEVRTLLDEHNAYRSKLARGLVSGQPEAADMQLLVWDDELAAKAEKHAAKEIFQHNPDIEIPSKRFKTGENLYMSMTTRRNPPRNMSAGPAAWFDEHRYYQYGKLTGTNDPRSGQVVGHYTQMAWAKTSYLGCAVSERRSGGWTKQIVVCNYGPAGNYLGEVPYKTGAGCEDLCCNSGSCAKLYGSKC